MELEFTDEQEELRDGVRSMLERECPMSLVRSIVEDGESADGLWKQMVDLGWPALTIAEEHGGLGLTTVELAVVVEELGRVVAPGPLLSTVSQFAPLVREAGSAEQQERFLGPIAEGSLTGALALTESATAFDPAAVEATATSDGDAWQLRGEKRYALGAVDADEIGVVARVEGSAGDDGVIALVVPRADVTITPVEALDATRSLGTVGLDGVKVTADRVLGEPGAATAGAV